MKMVAFLMVLPVKSIVFLPLIANALPSPIRSRAPLTVRAFPGSSGISSGIPVMKLVSPALVKKNFLALAVLFL